MSRKVFDSKALAKAFDGKIWGLRVVALRQTLRRQLDKARGAWARIAALGPTPKDPIAAEAAALEQKGDFAGALAVWQRTLHTNGLNGNGTANGNGHANGHTSNVRKVHFRIARLAALDHNWTAAVHCYMGVLATDPNDIRARRGVESSALRAAREAQSSARWREACDMWMALARVGGERNKVVRNMVFCARNGARESEARGDWQAALKFWEDYNGIDPDSASGKRAIERCLLCLARNAENGGYITQARGYWAAMLKRFPDDTRAKKGLVRTGGRPDAS